MLYGIPFGYREKSSHIFDKGAKEGLQITLSYPKAYLSHLSPTFLTSLLLSNSLCLFNRLRCRLIVPANDLSLLFLPNFLDEKFMPLISFVYASYTPSLNWFLCQKQGWCCFSKATSNLIHSGFQSTILKLSSLFCKHQPLPPLLQGSLQPPPTLTNTQKHPDTYILLVLFV